MKILKLRLENFQGVKEFEMEPHGMSCTVYGDNGTGKSTLYNAFTWLMYGKPSTEEKNYSPKTTGSHNLHHSVELTAELEDGALMILKKDFHEVYKTIKGSAQAVLSGHTTDYSVDGVPVNETQFKRVLTEIYCNAELAKMLTMYDYFLETMGIADRRNVLLQVCGDVDFMTVVDSDPELVDLPDMLRKQGNTAAMYTVDEYQKIAAREKGLVDKELRNIPLLINEAEKAKPEVVGLDVAAIENRIAAIQAQWRELESQRTGGEDVAAAMIRQEIAELESQRAAGEAQHAKDEAAKFKGTYDRIRNLRYMKSEIETDIMHMEQDIREHENEISRLNRRRDALLRDWQAEDEKQWTGDEVCPTCKRPLPPEQIAQAKEDFNIAKAQRLEEINQRGMRECSNTMIQAEQDEIKKLSDKIADKREQLKEVEQNLATAEKAVMASTDYKSTEEYQEYTRKISDLQSKLKDLRAAAAEADNVLSSKLRKLDAEIDAENRKKAALSLAEKQDARIAELGSREKELAAQYEALQKGIHLCELYTRSKAKLLSERINSKFKTLQFRLFIEQQNGGIADDCEALVPCATGLVPFKSANNAARINAGLEVIDVLADYYGVQMPVFVDNAESVTRIQETDTQVIRLVVSEADKTLRFEKGER
ncbi:MAG: hypothetical protein Q4C59_10320 [Lachnospiraceae bacterium]|nr:hypothetical protein [Lachnospiraceae bacterium]